MEPYLYSPISPFFELPSVKQLPLAWICLPQNDSELIAYLYIFRWAEHVARMREIQNFILKPEVVGDGFDWISLAWGPGFSL
jgi:hypothetical protein